jgi:hypothetical protein
MRLESDVLYKFTTELLPVALLMTTANIVPSADMTNGPQLPLLLLSWQPPVATNLLVETCVTLMEPPMPAAISSPEADKLGFASPGKTSSNDLLGRFHTLIPPETFARAAVVPSLEKAA